MQFQFDNTYAALPERFFARVRPAAVTAPRLIKVNRKLAEELGLDAEWLASEDGVRVLAGQTVPDEAAPIATAYAGHQFGHFVPQLGDGRAVLLGEVVDRNGQRRDIQLKGSGRTPFSRNGDGRAALGPVLREYIVSEAMAALGIPTTRSLAAVLTGETVMREAPLPGAVLTRVASSHIRIGTFQFFAARGDDDAIRQLADHVIARHYPDVRSEAEPYRALLARVIARQAQLVARWMQVGFIHGVMNTDNMSIAGETIDYGPCAFMDAFDPCRGVLLDRPERALRLRQPAAHRAVEFDAACRMPADAAVGQRGHGDRDRQGRAWRRSRLRSMLRLMKGMLAKLGIAGETDDGELIGEFLRLLAQSHADYTLAFRRLCDAADGKPDALRDMIIDLAAFDAWAAKWRQRRETRPLDVAAMRKVNPAFIPRNHRIEAAIQAAVRDDYAPFEELLTVLSKPYDDQPQFAAYAEPPKDDERVTQTFCGT